MPVSAFELFKIGIGPSSSHTVGPMVAANMFVSQLHSEGLLRQAVRVRTVLYGSLGATGKGHDTDKAVLLGLAGYRCDSADSDELDAAVRTIRLEGQLRLHGEHRIGIDEAADILFEGETVLPRHPNSLAFAAYAADARTLLEVIYYSVGGGFVVQDSQDLHALADSAEAPAAASGFGFRTGAELLALTERHACSIAHVMRMNERLRRSDAQIDDGLLGIWSVMQACVERGCRQEGVLPGGFRVRRRAAKLAADLRARGADNQDPLRAMEWVNLFALAVSEENAAGGRVVTAPTNGAAGIIPAVLHYYVNFIETASTQGVIEFLLTAAAIGALYKKNASISGAEVGCQGEVGVACSMAAAGLCAVLGASASQVENAAEIGMEHHLGLTCDPVGGLVQIPCIERNALASVKAINAARMALHGDGAHHVSLDAVIKTMRETGADMMSKYKETSRGGLAVNVVRC